MRLRRRAFLKRSGMAAAGLAMALPAAKAGEEIKLPEGSGPEPAELPHFPDRLHAFVWRNWTVVPLERMAKVLGASREEVLAIGESMGLSAPPPISADQLRRSYITIIRRNWHLLPYDQLLELLGWTPEYMAFVLREDDFLFVKLGSLKPKCARLRYSRPEEKAVRRAREIGALIRGNFPEGLSKSSDPLFGFVADLAKRSESPVTPGRTKNSAPRFCYSYFALYGDPLLEPEIDPYPDGYLEKLAELGVNGVWLQAVLSKLAPSPWVRENEEERARRLENLRKLTERAAKHGIGIYLYLNEPRAMPTGFFAAHPELKGVTEGNYAALCTSVSEVRESIRSAVAHICRAAPKLAGFFTITASENLTNCWSHGAGAQCPRCGKRPPGDVIAEVVTAFEEGIQKAGSKADLIAWDWGWHDDWAPGIIEKLPEPVALMSVSEWSIPIRRGGIESVVGEYSISTIGPGPRAKRHWELARKRGLRRLAKIQAGNTWELSAVPYIPALENVARHAANLKAEGVDGLMLGWTLGGYPSPNLETACAIAESRDGRSADELVNDTLTGVARRRFGEAAAPAVVQAWKAFSRAFSEFPFSGGLVYNAPMQFGPSNLLWAKPTGYKATMIGFPYDDLNGWRQNYPADVFIAQFNKMADGFDAAIDQLKKAVSVTGEVSREIDVAQAASIHFRSTANQARFVQLRDRIRAEEGGKEAGEELQGILKSETALARTLAEIQRRDSRIGFEASNQYYYVPQDLAEKVINCAWLMERL